LVLQDPDFRSAAPLRMLMLRATPPVDGVNHADRDLGFDVWRTQEDMLLGEPTMRASSVLPTSTRS
jgi:hypothetical protein